jgi:hypothetical protein
MPKKAYYSRCWLVSFLVASGLILIILRACADKTTTSPTSTASPTQTMIEGRLGVRVAPTPTMIDGKDRFLGLKVNDNPHGIGNFVEAIPTNWLTPTNGNPKYLIQIERIEIRNKDWTSDNALENCQYAPVGSSTPTHTLVRDRVDVEVTITDLETNTVVANQRFEGTEPSPCPAHRFASKTEIYLNYPSAEAFRSWLIDVMENTDLPPAATN